MKQVAKALGNTPTVCSKYYIHPEVANLFKEGKLEKLVSKAEKNAPDKDNGLFEQTVFLLLKELEKKS